jgi:hypothetical protein
MGTIVAQRGPAARSTSIQTRLDRLHDLVPEQMAHGLCYLAGYSPDTFNEVLAAVEHGAPQAPEHPEPICATCGANIGIFLKFGTRLAASHDPHPIRTPR